MKSALSLFMILILGITSVCAQLDGNPGPEMEDYEWWRKARFGIFICWDPSSMLELGGGSWYRDNPKYPRNERQGIPASTPGQLPESIKSGDYLKYKGVKGVPMEIYDNLYQVFNPTGFDVEEWARTFRDAGAGYIVFTVKHHGGFCMHDSKFTEYDIMSTPYGKDICQQLAEACQKYGIQVLWYYSVADWYHPDYYEVDPDNAYQDYLYGQVEELSTNYGDIAGFWWDGGHASTRTGKLFEMIQEHQPGFITNGRIANARKYGVAFSSPEQRLGKFDMDNPWETCAIVQGEGWFWNGGNNIKSPEKCLRMLIDCAGGDGNLLLDFGPDPDGRIDKRVKNVYLSMGEWLKKYGESIYGTRGGPYMPGVWGVSTRRGNTVYLHITQKWPGGQITLPAFPQKVLSARALTGGDPDIRQKGSGLEIRLPAEYHHPVNTLIALELEGDAMDIEPIDTKGQVDGSLTKDATVSASSRLSDGSKGHPSTVVLHSGETGQISGHYGEEVSDQGKKGTTKQVAPAPWGKNHRGHIWRYWMARGDDTHPWIEVDLESEKCFDRIYIQEKYSRIRFYELRYLDGLQWKTLHKGEGLDNLSLLLEEPLTSRKVRLQVLSFESDLEDQGPALSVFDLF